MFAKVVTAITSNAENLACIDSIPLLIPDIFTLLAAVLILFNPVEALLKFKLFFNLSSVLKLVLTPFSNCALSNFIETTRSSTCLLMFSNLLPCIIYYIIKNWLNSRINIISSFYPTSITSSMPIL